MPADMRQLINCLSEMKKIYLNNPTEAVRGSSFIYKLHEYCVMQLYSAIDNAKDKVQMIRLKDMAQPSGKPHYPRTLIEPNKYQLLQEVTLFGSHKNKDEDIALIHYANGPQIAIGIRSQMSSVGKNIENYYEGIIGECISLHDRFPMATLGYVYLLPKNPIKPGLAEEIDLVRAETLFKKIIGRLDWHSPNDKYEHFAFLKVDFKQDPPAIIPSDPALSIETFFDRLIATHNDRNLYNQL
ncbi:MAG: hypothetical protein MJ215_01570 [Spirochaetia bacterium]|nr:hypothetical protein [Spirochaetia bacterium]